MNLNNFNLEEAVEDVLHSLESYEELLDACLTAKPVIDAITTNVGKTIAERPENTNGSTRENSLSTLSAEVHKIVLKKLSSNLDSMDLDVIEKANLTKIIAKMGAYLACEDSVNEQSMLLSKANDDLASIKAILSNDSKEERYLKLEDANKTLTTKNTTLETDVEKLEIQRGRYMVFILGVAFIAAVIAIPILVLLLMKSSIIMSASIMSLKISSGVLATLIAASGIGLIGSMLKQSDINVKEKEIASNCALITENKKAMMAMNYHQLKNELAVCKADVERISVSYEAAQERVNTVRNDVSAIKSQGFFSDESKTPRTTPMNPWLNDGNAHALSFGSL